MIGRGHSGQAVLEGVFATMTLMIFAICAITAAYLCFARIWIEYQLDQTALCLAKTTQSRKCISRLETQAKRMLPFGKWQAQGRGAGGKYLVIAHYQMAGKVDWRWKKVLDVENLDGKAKRVRSRG